MTNIKETTIKTVAAMIQCEPGEISGESRLTQDLRIKSANRIALSALLEDQFQVVLTVFDIMKVTTIDELVALITSKQSK